VRRPEPGTPHPEPRTNREPGTLNPELDHVLPSRRHGANLARRPEPGAADGQRPPIDRAASRAGGTSRWRAPPPRGRGSRPDSDRTADGDGSVDRVEILANHQAASARRHPRTRSPRRGVRRAGAVDRIRSVERGDGPGAGRRAPGRLPPERELVFALEVPPGRLLHRRVRSHPADAGRRRRAGRPGCHGP
jgi:hypothetical protein